MRIVKLLSCLTLSLSLVSPVFAKPTSLDGIAAVVNDSIITQSDLRRQTRMVEQQLRHNGNAPNDHAALEKQVLDHMITNEVQLQFAKKTGIQVDDVALDSAIENIAKENNMTVTQLREAISREGMDFSHYRNNIRQQMTLSQLQQRDVLRDVQVSDQEVAQFLQSPNGLGGMINEYRLGHILVALPEAPSPQELDKANQKVKQILSELRGGKDFSQVAITYSQDEQALKGGDLGWRKLPELPTLFEKIVPTLRAGEVPEPIRSSSGYHIIKLLDKRNAAQTQASTSKTLVRHILIKTNTNMTDEDAKQRLVEYKQKILKGADFAELAKAHSADLGSASNGGSLGWVTKDVLVPEFSHVMDSLALQDISEPFKTPFGWHIMQVQERKTETSDKALYQKAREMIQQRKYEEKLQAWARQLRDEAYIKTQFDS